MSQATYIIDRFGGVTALARALGHRWPSTVQEWKRSGFIPPRHYEAILTAGIELDPPFEPREFGESREGAVHHWGVA